ENPTATLPLGIGSAHSHAAAQLLDAQVAAASRSLNARSGGPSQTPVVRRTGTLQTPAPEPLKKNRVATILAAIFLLCVIVFGAQKIRPVVQAARHQNPSNETQVEVLQGPVAIKAPETERIADPAAVSPAAIDPSAASANSTSVLPKSSI